VSPSATISEKTDTILLVAAFSIKATRVGVNGIMALQNPLDAMVGTIGKD
jgi:hypothetical protein